MPILRAEMHIAVVDLCIHVIIYFLWDENANPIGIVLS